MLGCHLFNLGSKLSTSKTGWSGSIFIIPRSENSTPTTRSACISLTKCEILLKIFEHEAVVSRPRLGSSLFLLPEMMPLSYRFLFTKAYVRNQTFIVAPSMEGGFLSFFAILCFTSPLFLPLLDGKACQKAAGLQIA